MFDFNRFVFVSFVYKRGRLKHESPLKRKSRFGRRPNGRACLFVPFEGKEEEMSKSTAWIRTSFAAVLAALSFAAVADEQSVRDNLMKNTGLRAEAVTPSPIPGLWEVFIQDRLFQSDYDRYLLELEAQAEGTQEANLIDKGKSEGE